MKKNILWILLGVIVLLFGTGILLIFFSRKIVSVDLEKLTYSNEKIKVYEIEDFDQFVKDYHNNKLEDVYVTKFLFDGVGMYKAPDLDDYIEKGNEYEPKTLETTVFNVHNLGNYEFKGNLTGMIAVNSNSLKGNINIILNNVSIDTDSKKIPALYVYHKDILNEDCHVTIETKKGTSNKIVGGKLKKVSLVGKDEIENYKNKYSGEVLEHYNTYTNYYGVYEKDKINDILFAMTTADQEDLMDGDPYLYYKASGAISSDIDLYFRGKGKLEVVSKNKEGIETKGNLTLSGGSGDYIVTAEDDCLNTTTDSKENKNAHNAIVIDVHSLTAIVSLDAEEGDAIDSNGSLTINGGTIIALSQFGADSGIDSETGTVINKGEVIATQSMMDTVSSESKQRYISISTTQDKDSLIAMLDKKKKLVFAFQSDRRYSTLIYSSPKLKDETYHFYQDGSVKGNSNYGFYSTGSYTMGTQLGYTSKSSITGNGGFGGGMGPGGQNGQPPQMPNGEAPQGPNGEQPGQAGPNGEQPPEMPNGQAPQMPDGQNGQVPAKPDGQTPQGPNGEQPPEMPNGEQPPEMPNGQVPEMPNGQIPAMSGNAMNSNPVNADFTLEGISNVFSGVGKLVKE